MTRIFEKISKPKCDFEATAAAQNKAMNLKFLLNSAVGKLPRFLKKKIILVAFRCSAKFWVIFEAVLMFNQCGIEVVVSSSPVFLPDDLPNMPSVR